MADEQLVLSFPAGWILHRPAARIRLCHRLLLGLRDFQFKDKRGFVVRVNCRIGIRRPEQVELEDRLGKPPPGPVLVETVAGRQDMCLGDRRACASPDQVASLIQEIHPADRPEIRAHIGIGRQAVDEGVIDPPAKHLRHLRRIRISAGALVLGRIGLSERGAVSQPDRRPRAGLAYLDSISGKQRRDRIPRQRKQSPSKDRKNR